MGRKHYQSSNRRILAMTEQELLDTRICDLDLSIEGSWVAPQVERLYEELEARDLQLRPHCWFSDEWFSPDGIPGIAIPFYLAHERLMRLERKQMIEVEGGTRPWLMRILRHEAGHALDTAFRLHRRRSYREIFGNYFSPYPDSYRPRPRSRSFVRHLDPWYAQSHPAEDFAETFAVWLAPGSRWKQTYQGWRALAKLEYVESLMQEIADSPPKVKSRIRIEPTSRIRRTLREHYRALHEKFQIDYSDVNLDSSLQKVFVKKAREDTDIPAERFLARWRNELCQIVHQFTGDNPYNVNQLIIQLAGRAATLKLFAHGDTQVLQQRLVAMLTSLTMNFLHSQQHRVAL